MLSNATTSHATARGWLKRLGHGLDGIVAKRLDLPYRAGDRAMQKYKLWQTVDCVVGGIYYKRATQSVEYLLMGLYDRRWTAELCRPVRDRRQWPLRSRKLLKPLIGGSGFTGNAPGGTESLVSARAQTHSVGTETGCRSECRSYRERPLPSWITANPLARRQGADGLYDGSNHWFFAVWCGLKRPQEGELRSSFPAMR